MSFEKLKQSRASVISKLVEASTTENSKQSFTDETLWNPTVDKAGNGYAIIRFLPAPEGEDLPWVRFWDHGFQGPTGRWYIERSLTSLGQPDPVSELNSQLWNSGREEDKEVARSRKRRLHYVSNILVVSDSSNPESEGKVYRFKYGKKIMDKIMDIMQPQFEDEKPINPFDFWAGANFKLKIRKFEGYRNYDKSEFDKPSELFNGDERKLEEVYNNLYPLKEYIAPTTFKSYEELSKKLKMVLASEAHISDHAVANPADSAPSAPAPKHASSPAPLDTEDEEDTQTLGYFAKLAQAGS